MSTVYSTISSFQEAIYDWLDPFVSEQIVWAREKAPAPTSAYLSLDLTSKAIAEGAGVEKQISGSTTLVVQRRHAVLNIQAFGTNAVERLFDLKTKVYLESSQELLRAKNISLLNDDDVVDLSLLLNTEFQERASMDLTIGYTKSESENVNWIETVEVTDLFGDTTVIE